MNRDQAVSAAPVYMHRQIMGFPIAEVDHRNRNALDNRRENLRLASDMQQAANRTSSNRLGLRGVRKKANRFEARINEQRRYRCLGYYLTATEAALAYDAAAKLIFGEFAVLNFP